MMDLQPIYGQPILSADEYLVVGDLHIGVESHLRSKGFHLVSHTDDMIKDLRDAAETGASKLIVLGDVKDSVPGSNRQEYREIPDFFETLFETFDSIDLVRGNHDTNIEEFVPSRVKLHPATGMKIREVGFVHGHMWPSNDVMACKTLVMAHNHPTVMFKDGVGRRTTEPCWMRGRFKEDAASERYSELPEQFLI
ncbi:MAG: metallophosphoesterase family protein, partial [Candidatus Methanomethylophilaceae archaeon]|nr:metallophosphoesterase family protein [Candidatus Methanomethylophilaceae archaeon]